MLTAEQKAEIGRANGPGSRGPVTPEGRERSSRSALKTGEHAVKFRHLLPPHAAVLCHEDRALFYDIFDTLLKTYRPPCQVSGHIVREIAYAQWEINRNNAQKSALWNSELVRQAAQPQNVAPELHDLEAMNAATRVLYGPGGIIPKLNREIHRLTQHIVRLERRLQFVMTNFPAFESTAITSAEERAFFLSEEDENEPTPASTADEERTNVESPQAVDSKNTEPSGMPSTATGPGPKVPTFYQHFVPGPELYLIEPEERSAQPLKTYPWTRSGQRHPPETAPNRFER